MAKKIAVLVEDMYNIPELWVPYYRLKEEGYEVLLVGTGSKKTYESKEGYPASEDVGIQSVKADDFIGVVVPGGFAPDILRRSEDIKRFVRNLDEKGRLVASICHGPWVLISAGVVKGRTVTCTSAIKDDIVNAGANYVDKEVVVDGNLITSRAPNDLPAFTKEIVKFLRG